MREVRAAEAWRRSKTRKSHPPARTRQTRAARSELSLGQIDPLACTWDTSGKLGREWKFVLLELCLRCILCASVEVRLVMVQVVLDQVSALRSPGLCMQPSTVTRRKIIASTLANARITRDTDRSSRRALVSIDDRVGPNVVAR